MMKKVFYEALQQNRAHCKLEVLDVNGQIRFVQRALYEGDHHELGILFVLKMKKNGKQRREYSELHLYMEHLIYSFFVFNRNQIMTNKMI